MIGVASVLTDKLSSKPIIDTKIVKCNLIQSLILPLPHRCESSACKKKAYWIQSILYPILNWSKFCTNIKIKSCNLTIIKEDKIYKDIFLLVLKSYKTVKKTDT